MLKQLAIAVFMLTATLLFAGMYVQSGVDANPNRECGTQVDLVAFKLCYGAVERVQRAPGQLDSGHWFSCEDAFVATGETGRVCAPLGTGLGFLNDTPAVLVIGDAGSTAFQTEASACLFFSHEGWTCLALDSTTEPGESPAQTLARIREALAYLARNETVDPSKIMLWGEGSGGLVALKAAAGRDDIFAVMVASPPLLYSRDQSAAGFEGIWNLDANLIYVLSKSGDVTDTETAQAMVEGAGMNHKRAVYTMMDGTGSACCGRKNVMEIQYNWVAALING